MGKVININFKENETDLIELQERFNDVGQEAIYMSHHELAERTGIGALAWRNFITDPRVSSFITEEVELIKRSKAVALLKDIENNKSTGQAQLLNTLLNQTKASSIKEGPAFIYCFIPPNAQEKNGENVEVLDVDPFKIDE